MGHGEFEQQPLHVKASLLERSELVEVPGCADRRCPRSLFRCRRALPTLS